MMSLLVKNKAPGDTETLCFLFLNYSNKETPLNTSGIDEHSCIQEVNICSSLLPSHGGMIPV